MSTRKYSRMKTSNKFLVGAGLVLAALVLSMVISARVVFDQDILPNIDRGVATFVQNR